MNKNAFRIAKNIYFNIRELIFLKIESISIHFNSFLFAGLPSGLSYCTIINNVHIRGLLFH